MLHATLSRCGLGRVGLGRMSDSLTSAAEAVVLSLAAYRHY
jgi:hypothetical protein